MKPVQSDNFPSRIGHFSPAVERRYDQLFFGVESNSRYCGAIAAARVLRPAEGLDSSVTCVKRVLSGSYVGEKDDIGSAEWLLGECLNTLRFNSFLVEMKMRSLMHFVFCCRVVPCKCCRLPPNFGKCDRPNRWDQKGMIIKVRCLERILKNKGGKEVHWSWSPLGEKWSARSNPWSPCWFVTEHCSAAGMLRSTCTVLPATPCLWTWLGWSLDEKMERWWEMEPVKIVKMQMRTENRSRLHWYMHWHHSLIPLQLLRHRNCVNMPNHSFNPADEC